MKKVLIVVDMQNDFIDGNLGTKEAVEIVPIVEEKIKEYIKGGEKIIFTRDTHNENYLDTQEGKKLPIKHCLYDTDGWEIRPELVNTVINANYALNIIDKKSFGYPYWKEILGVDYCGEIELVGLCTDICVVSNALILKALYPEVRIVINSKCCAGSTPESHKVALDTMRSCQIEII